MVAKTFENWKIQVNQAIEKKVGLSCDDLPDVDYYSMFDDGVSPAQAANKAIKNAMEY